MIAYMEGTLVSQAPGQVVLDMNGMGMRLLVPSSIAEYLPSLGTRLKLHTYLHWRDDGPQLFGFADVAELELFQKLISVSGIGPKVALAILGYAPPARLLVWLMNEDLAQLRKIPGIGLKTAQRLVLELKEKAAVLAEGTDLSALRTSSPQVDSESMQALEALVSLGYESNQAAKVIAAVQAELPEANLETLIREGLKRSVRA